MTATCSLVTPPTEPINVLDAPRFTPSQLSRLIPADIAAFARLGIPSELLAQARVQRVTDLEARERYGIKGPATSDMSGIVFPYSNVASGVRVTARVRRDNPEVEDGKEKNKYISAYGDRKHLYFPPGAADKLEEMSEISGRGPGAEKTVGVVAVRQADQA